jgi:prevent-host-death family protein
MDKAVSAADANRRFSELMRTVKKGRSVIVTSHGKPVAKITPFVEDERGRRGGALCPFRPAPNRTSCECLPLDT